MSISQEIKKRAGKKDQSPDWYAKQLSDSLNKFQKVDSSTRDTKGLTVGQLYFFRYTPQKPRKGLVYDRNPLAFIMDIQGETILGVNLHHASPQIRKIIAKSLLNKLDATSIPRDCYRTYYVRGCSNFQKVPEKYWEDISDLPTEKFFSINQNYIQSNKAWENKS
jgi:hypothetical protein